MSTPHTMVIVDDHPIVRHGLSDHLSLDPHFVVSATGANAEEAIHLCREHQPDMLLLDVEMPGRDALGAIADIKAASPKTQVVLVTSYCREPIIDAAVRNGAAGYLLKSDPVVDLKAALTRILDGERVYSKGVMARMSSNPAATTPLGALHPRELESLRYIGRGMTNAEMARVMHISVRTVERHVLRLMRSLKINDRTQLTALAHKSGLVS